MRLLCCTLLPPSPLLSPPALPPPPLSLPRRCAAAAAAAAASSSATVTNAAAAAPPLCCPAQHAGLLMLLLQAYLESGEEMILHCLPPAVPAIIMPPAVPAIIMPPDDLAHAASHFALLPQAYLESDEEVIKEHCSPEMIERLTGIMRVQKEQVRAVAVLPSVLRCTAFYTGFCIGCSIVGGVAADVRSRPVMAAGVWAHGLQVSPSWCNASQRLPLHPMHPHIAGGFARLLLLRTACCRPTILDTRDVHSRLAACLPSPCFDTPSAVQCLAAQGLVPGLTGVPPSWDASEVEQLAYHPTPNRCVVSVCINAGPGP